MMDEDAPSPPPSDATGPREGPVREGHVLGGQWRLGRQLATRDAGDLYEAQHETTRQDAAIWVLSPRAGGDPITIQALRRTMRFDRALGLRLTDIVQDQALGLTYVVMQSTGDPTMDLLRSWLTLLREMADQLPPLTEPPSAAPAPASEAQPAAEAGEASEGWADAASPSASSAWEASPPPPTLSAWSPPPPAAALSEGWSASPPPEPIAASWGASSGSLGWLEERRREAALAGAAPFVTSRPPADAWGRPGSSNEVDWSRGELASSAAPSDPPPPMSARPPPPMPSAGAPAPPSRRRGPHPALWGSAAAVGVLVIGSAALMQTGGPRPVAGPMVGAPAPVNDTTAGPVASPGGPDSTSPSPTGPDAPDASAGDPVRALAGAWGLDGDCGRPTYLTVVEGRLIGQGAAGPIEIGAIQRVEPDGGVVVGAPGGGATTYRVSGESLTAASGQGPPLRFTRCPTPDADNAANVAGEAALIAMAMAGAGGPSPEPPPEPPQEPPPEPPQEPPPIRDEVDVSAFAPKQMRAGDVALVQIYLHLVDQADAVAERARAADAEAAPRGQTTLGLELARGARVDIMLDAGGLGLEESIQPVIWRGRPCAAQFAVTAAADAKLGQRVLTARVLVEGVPLGRLSFTLTVAPAEAAIAAHAELAGDFARRYDRAFLSYSSLDRPEVLKTTQTLRATGIDYFQDILSIEPGEAWRERLFAEIDRCDLFLLFWSSHAAGSKWVLEEAEHALARRHGSTGTSTGASPDIRPIILEGPPIPPPPPSLAELHFNDMLRYVVVASELEARARRPDAGG
ncbi:MAG TPA: TIR domain-containing protein [Caulobacteraceae bacterium]|nr:TIR domain-containing protein [Caulobacteraceae bacterium]